MSKERFVKPTIRDIDPETAFTTLTTAPMPPRYFIAQFLPKGLVDTSEPKTSEELYEQRIDPLTRIEIEYDNEKEDLNITVFHGDEEHPSPEDEKPHLIDESELANTLVKEGFRVQSVTFISDAGADGKNPGYEHMRMSDSLLFRLKKIGYELYWGYMKFKDDSDEKMGTEVTIDRNHMEVIIGNHRSMDEITSFTNWGVLNNKNSR